VNLERILDRAMATRDAALLLWRDPYLLYRLRRYQRHLVSTAWARANEYVARVPTYHDMAEAWRARAQEQRNARRIDAYDYNTASEDALELHKKWLAGERNIPITRRKEQ
jgi:hypothetical protein